MKPFSRLQKLFIALTLFFWTLPVFAVVQLQNPLNISAEGGGVASLRQIVGLVIGSLILRIVGSIALLMFVIGGYLWLTSAGNSDKIQKGKDVMVYTAIGLLIIFGAYTAITFLFQVLPVAQ